MDERTLLQDLVDWQCYGCGRLNELGLQIKSYWSGDELVCNWLPKSFHAGHPGTLHHGVTATIMFCHGAWAATSRAHRNEGREIQNPIEYFFSNRSLRFDVLSPIPIESTVTLRAKVVRLEGDEADVATSAYAEETECARGETHLVRVSADEMEF